VKCTKLHPKLSSGSSITVIEQEVLGKNFWQLLSIKYSKIS